MCKTLNLGRRSLVVALGSKHVHPRKRWATVTRGGGITCRALGLSRRFVVVAITRPAGGAA